MVSLSPSPLSLFVIAGKNVRLSEVEKLQILLGTRKDGLIRTGPIFAVKHYYIRNGLE